MATKKKTTEPMRQLKPIPCGECRDTQGKRIGRYLWIEDDQETLDQFFECWIQTYNSDNRFFVTLDLETQGLDFTLDKILLVSICWNGSDAIIFDPLNYNLDKFKEFLDTVPINNHNIKFDFKFLKYAYGVNPKIYFDTMTASQMAFAGIFKFFGLDSLVEKLLPVYKISKETRNTFIGKTVGSGYTREQIEYAARDSILTHQLVRPIIRKLVKDGQYQLWDKIDRNVLQLLVDSELAGVKIDYDKLLTVYTEMKEELVGLFDTLQVQVKEIPMEKLPKLYRGKEFNPMSHKQIIPYLKAYGLEVESTGKDILNDLKAKNNCDFLNTLIDYKALHAKVNKQMRAWLEESYNPITHSAHPNFFVCGAVTGRLSCTSPPLHQVPKPLRIFVVANEGKAFVCMDYASFEFRACAAKSGEAKLIDALFKREEQMPIAREICATYDVKNKAGEVVGVYDDPDDWMKDVMKKKVDLRSSDTEFFRAFVSTDIHCINAASAFKKPVWECSASDRQIGKTLGYAVLYGAGPEKIRESCIKEKREMSVEQAAILIRTFYDENPAVKKMMQEIAQEVIDTNSISTVLGRRRSFMLPPKWQSDRRKRDLLSAIRQAGNYVFQAANADATKLAMVRLELAYQEFWDFDRKPVIKLNVHDEIVTECWIEDIDKVIAIKRPIMIEAGKVVTKFKVPIDVSVSHGHQWVN